MTKEAVINWYDHYFKGSYIGDNNLYPTDKILYLNNKEVMIELPYEEIVRIDLHVNFYDDIWNTNIQFTLKSGAYINFNFK